MSKTISHDIDLAAPGGIDRLFAFWRAQAGDLQMNANAGGGTGGEGGGDGTGEQPKPSEQPGGENGAPKPGENGGEDGDKSGDEKLGEPGVKALKAERDARSKAEKELADARAQLQAIEDAKLSDAQRAEKEKREAIERAEKAERETWRLAALTEYPVSKDNRDLVVGTDAATYLASAKRISELEAAGTGTGGTRRREAVPDSGTRSDDQGSKSTGGVAAGREMFADKHKKKEG